MVVLTSSTKGLEVITRANTVFFESNVSDGSSSFVHQVESLSFGDIHFSGVVEHAGKAKSSLNTALEVKSCSVLDGRNLDWDASDRNVKDKQLLNLPVPVVNVASPEIPSVLTTKLTSTASFSDTEPAQGSRNKYVNKYCYMKIRPIFLTKQSTDREGRTNRSFAQMIIILGLRSVSERYF